MTKLLPAKESMVDRIVRLGLGVALFAPLALGGGKVTVWSGLAAAGGAIMLFTGAVGSCPIYTALGLSTKSKAA